MVSTHFLISSTSVPLASLWGSLRGQQIQLVSLSRSCTITFFYFYVLFSSYSFLHLFKFTSGPLEKRSRISNEWYSPGSPLLSFSYRVKINGNEKKNNYLCLSRELDRLRNIKVTVILIVIGARNNPQRLGKRTGRHRNQKTSRNQPLYSIIKIGQNTKNGPGDWRSLAFSQTLLEDHQLTPVGKMVRTLVVTKSKK